MITKDCYTIFNLKEWQIVLNHSGTPWGSEIGNYIAFRYKSTVRFISLCHYGRASYIFNDDEIQTGLNDEYYILPESDKDIDYIVNQCKLILSHVKEYDLSDESKIVLQNYINNNRL